MAKIRAAALNRDYLLSENNEATVGQKNENDIFLILIYNPANPDVKGTIQKYLPIINSSKFLEVLHDKNVVWHTW